MFIAALFTIARRWKQPECPLTDEWIKKMWNLHTMEYHAAFKNKEILSHVATSMDLEDIMLSKVISLSLSLTHTHTHTHTHTLYDSAYIKHLKSSKS